jgi:hypothetical protein
MWRIVNLLWMIFLGIAKFTMAVAANDPRETVVGSSGDVVSFQAMRVTLTTDATRRIICAEASKRPPFTPRFLSFT